MLSPCTLQAETNQKSSSVHRQKVEKSAKKHKRHLEERLTSHHTEKARHHKKKHASRHHAHRSDFHLPTSESSHTWLEHAQQGQLAGKASWYGHDFHGGPTASGLRYDMYTFTAAHRTLPIGTVVRVTRQDSGKSVMVCVTDRGPFVRGRIIDLSYAAAEELGLRKKGVGDVNLEVVSDAKGTPLMEQEAFYVKFKAAKGIEKSGPFKEFADACAMQEALRQAHPDASVVLEKTQQ
ncbi:MAG: septal ring lytic transglycosylase RlpA family protein [Desulfovibrio sp.]|nr:septal ring lytic transglycosylase RlpA family protein [Desulfovibrio sp.]